jgi:hypothetical protein
MLAGQRHLKRGPVANRRKSVAEDGRISDEVPID